MAENMAESKENLVKIIVNALVDNKEAVNITSEGSVIKVKVAKEDMGKVIGKEGRIAKSIRTIIRSACANEQTKYSVEIVE